MISLARGVASAAAFTCFSSAFSTIWLSNTGRVQKKRPKKVESTGIVTVDDEVFYTLLDELFPDDEDLVEADENDRQAHENSDASILSASRA